MSQSRIITLERLIPKLKSTSKIKPQKIEALEWELKALKAQLELDTIKQWKSEASKLISYYYHSYDLSLMERTRAECLVDGIEKPFLENPALLDATIDNADSALSDAKLFRDLKQTIIQVENDISLNDSKLSLVTIGLVNETMKSILS